MRSVAPICTKHKMPLHIVRYGRDGSNGYIIQQLRRCRKCAAEAAEKIALERQRRRNNKTVALFEGLR